jgi:hypothetical protein
MKRTIVLLADDHPPYGVRGRRWLEQEIDMAETPNQKIRTRADRMSGCLFQFSENTVDETARKGHASRTFSKEWILNA